MAEVQQIKPPQTPPPRVHRDELSSAEEYPDEKVRSHHGESTTYHEEEKARDPTSDAYEPNVWQPFEEEAGAPEETHQLTVRALVVGSVLGAVVGASNIYLGLKTGFTFGPQLFGAIFGFAILKPLSKALPESGILGKLLGGHFGPKENCTVQTAATASGGLGILFVSAIPAMYRLHLLSEDPRDDIGRLIALTVSAGFFGVFFAIPLRKYFIIHQRLVFPTPTATAFTIRSLHSGKTGAQVARKKSLALLYSLLVVFCYKVATGYAPGLIYDWHIGWTLYQLGWRGALSIENYGWFIEFTPAFFGAGMLSGINASWSFFMGSVLAWGVIAPSLIKNGQAVGIPIGGDEYPTAYSYMGMSFESNSDYIDNPSPRYWLLWPGVFMMLIFSFAELFMSSRSLIGGLKIAGASFKDAISRLRNPDAAASPDSEDVDPSKPEDRVKPWIWITGLFLSVVMSCALLATQFSVGVGEAILALLLGFMFSFIGVQSAGDTDINPVSTVAKASQLVFGGVSKGQGHDIKTGQTLNLVAGTIAAGSAAQATDMTGDLRTGHLLSAKPKNQFVAQLVGSVVASFLTVGLYVLFASASPCIMYPPEDGHCTYGAPSVSAWAAVAVAVTSPRLPIPKSSGYTSIALGIFAGLSVVVKHLWIPRRYWKYVPNWNAVGLGFVVPQVYYSIAMAVGSVVTWFWLKNSPISYDMYLFPLSAGMLAGEGLGGVFQALLQVAGVAGAEFGTAIGCPYFEFCG